MAQHSRRRRDTHEPAAPPAPAVETVVATPVTAPTVVPKVQIRNVTDQLVECSVLNEDGQQVAVRLMARGVSIPYFESQIDPYTQALVARGLLKLEPAR